MSLPRYPEYKPSGVEWLGEVPEHWSVAPAKWHMRSATGGTSIKGHCADETAVGLYPGFSASGQDVWLAGYDFEVPGIVLSAVGARCGKTFKADGAWGVVANTHCVFPTQGSDRDYLWFLTNREDWWEKGGSAQPFVKVSDTLARKWVFPPLIEQTQIATFLDRETAKIDELVAEQRRLMELLKEKRQAVISHAVTKGLNPNAPMKPSGIEWLGDVPAHWEICLLKRAFRSVDYGISDSLDSEGSVAILRMGNIANGKVVTDDLKYIDSVDPYLLLQPGDLLYNRTNSLDLIGKVGMFIGNGDAPVSFASYLVRLRTVGESLPDYFAYLLNTEGILGLARSNAFVAIGQCNLNPTRYGQITVAIPPRAEQTAIVEYLDTETAKLDTLTAEAQRAIDLLQERRTALISAAVTGQIDVRPH